MKNLRLRQFEEKDKAKVCNLHIAGLQQSDSLIRDPAARAELDKDLERIREEYINNHGEFLVVLLEGNLVGMGGLRKVDGSTAEIKRMRVDSTLQKRGIGGTILDRLIETAKKLGYKKLILDTSINQIPAQHLYTSRGFQEYKRGEIYGQETIYFHLDL